MVKQGSLLSELQSIVGKKHAREPKDDLGYCVDGLSPKAIAEPGTYEEVAEVLRFANTEHFAVIPRGSGFFANLGNIPARYDIALSLTRLDRVIEHEPADMTATCQAGVTLAGLHEHLAPSGQMVPFSPTPAERLTVGGLLALNEGRMRLIHGAPRDFTIGLRVVTADGRISKAGGRVVKNVAGYDLCKLYIGSFGTLGVIVEATFKLFPLLETRRTLEFECDSIEKTHLVAAEVVRRGFGVISIVTRRIMRADEGRFVPVSGYLSAFTFTGSDAAVGRTLAEVRAIAETQGVQESERGKRPKRDEELPAWVSGEPPLICSASVLPSAVPALVHAFERETPGPFLDIDPLPGEVTGTWLGAADQPAIVDRLRTATARLGGHLFVRGCSPDLKRVIDVFGPRPRSFPLIRAVKQQFDPNNVLSPGRFVGRL